MRPYNVIMSSMLKLLIFDLDGTLVETAQDIANAINHAVKPFGGKKYSVEEVKMLVGSGIANLLEGLIADLKDGGSPESKELVTKRFTDFYAEHLMDNSHLYPHVKDTLLKLKSHKLTVLTNKREKYSKLILNKLDLLEDFDLVWGSDSVREKKPSPIAIFDMIEKFGVTKDETAIIGDSNFDVEAGKAAGIKVVGVTYGFRPRSYLEGSDHIIDSFDELLNIIPKM